MNSGAGDRGSGGAGVLRDGVLGVGAGEPHAGVLVPGDGVGVPGAELMVYWSSPYSDVECSTAKSAAAPMSSLS